MTFVNLFPKSTITVSLKNSFAGFFAGRLLERPSAKTKKTMGDRAFQVAAPLLWNKLPRSARNTMNLESFKTLIKTFLFKESFQLS